tara:strand:- start:4087 stop:4947 length:861 start_codon:yes stop_codon:yes gene_type:complete
MKRIIITESQYKILINESSFVFPIGNDNFNVGYDNQGLGYGVKNKVLDREKSLHNSDYGGGDAAHRERGGHLGIDIFAPKGTPLVACVNGEIYGIKLGISVGGNTVNIKGDDGKNYYYAHLDSVNNELEEGDKINKGEFLGTVGNTGSASGSHPHLHFSIYKGNYRRGSIDPWEYLNSTLNKEEITVIDKNDVIEKVDGKVVTGEIYIDDILDNMDNSELISVGSKGDGVKEIQEILLDLDYELPEYGADSIFGSETKEAVEDFQTDREIEVDGIVGIETSEELKS